MPKSKSEHSDLEGKSRKMKRTPPRGKSSDRDGISKSPGSNKLRPGLVIPDLKLKPSGQVASASASDSRDDSEKFRMASETTKLAKVRPESNKSSENTASSDQARANVWGRRPGPVTVSMEDTLTQSRMSELELASLTPAGLQEAHMLAQSSYTGLGMAESDYSEMGDSLSLVTDIGPPSIMMDSLPSITQPLSLAPVPATLKEAAPASKLPCRHTISGKLGSSVPVAVRRALGGSGLGSLSSEDLSSISSCHSNIDNVAPPSMLEDLDMENSMISVASISSEVAAQLAGSGHSDDVSVSLLTSEAIREIVRPAARAVESFDLPSLAVDNGSVSHQLESVSAPTVMEDITLTQGTVTLKPAPAAATYIIDDGADTIADVTDAFDEESVVEQTLTAGKDADDIADIPDLPRDSKGNTPAQSGGESSVETTPLSQRRKMSPKERRQVDKDRYLTFTKSNSSGQSKNDDHPSPGQKFRKARMSDDERFRTRTITKEDLSSPNSSPDKSSPRSIKQRRSEEAARYLTHTITPADLKQAEADQESLSAAVLEAEARLVVKTISARKAEAKSRSASADPRSRSASTEILRDHEMTKMDADSCVSSQENLLDDEPRVPGKPRICKPWESRVLQQDDSPQKSVRGRRRALYSPPMKRATVPPQLAPRPTARPRTSSSPSSTSPCQLPRATRATQLRQASSSTLRSASGSTSPRSLNSSSGSMVSPRSLTSPHLRGASTSPRHPPARKLSPDIRRGQSPGGQERPVLIRQGTFTKDDDTNSNSSQSTTKTCLPKPTSVAKKTPPKTAPKPTLFIRKDTIQPSPSGRPTLTMAGTTKTQQLREQSFTRGSTVRSSASSNSSVTSKTSVVSRNSMRPSASSHSLRNATDVAPKRIPSSSDIERRKTSATQIPAAKINPAVAPKTATTGKKNVTSKIASLWKKVEESKNKADTEKNSKKYKPKDKRVWITKGKIQTTDNVPASSGSNLVRSGTYDKINEMTDSPSIPQSQPELKPRSRSRLSIKLSKFSLKKKGSVEDQANGNALSPDTDPSSPNDELGNSIQIVSPSSEGSEAATSPVTSEAIKMNPQPRQPNLTFKSPGSNRSPASAIVAPFNYNPHQAGVQLKRNTSYVSSLGRKREEQPSSEESDVQTADCDQKQMNASLTNSAMVTLV